MTPQTVQDYLADATQKASVDLTTAFLRIPEGRRAGIIATHPLPAGSAENHSREKSEAMAQDWEQIQAQFQVNTSDLAAAIRAVLGEDTDTVVAMPWGPMTIAQMAAFPHWNMTYHEGRINYIASILGCLEGHIPGAKSGRHAAAPDQTNVPAGFDHYPGLTIISTAL